jgi:hypothetical protein
MFFFQDLQTANGIPPMGNWNLAVHMDNQRLESSLWNPYSFYIFNKKSMVTRNLIFIFYLTVCSSQSANAQVIEPKKSDSSNVDVADTNLSLLLDSVYAMKPGRYNPEVLIDCANRLVSLEKDSVIVAIKSAFERGNSDSEGYGLFLLLQLVFELPADKAYPEMHFGKPDIKPSLSALRANRYPLLLVNNIPFLVVQNTFMTGPGDSVDEHLSFYRKFGKVTAYRFDLDITLTKDQLLELVAITWNNVYPNTLFSSVQAEMEQQIGVLYQ